MHSTTLQRDLVSQLGLAGISTLNVVDGPTAEELAAQEEAEAEETLVVKVHKKEMGLGLMKDAKKATGDLEPEFETNQRGI